MYTNQVGVMDCLALVRYRVSSVERPDSQGDYGTILLSD